jgi:hypothetical protein
MEYSIAVRKVMHELLGLLQLGRLRIAAPAATA